MSQPEITIIKRRKPVSAPAPAPVPTARRAKITECVVAGCTERRLYGYELGRAICCGTHKAECARLHDGWVPFNTGDKYCEICYTKAIVEKTKPKRATYGFAGKPATRCCKDKETGMIDVKAPRCVGPDGEGCPDNAVAFHGYGSATWCSKCKPDDEDVVNMTAPRCECGEIATFGVDTKPIVCKKCAIKSNKINGTEYAYTKK